MKTNLKYILAGTVWAVFTGSALADDTTMRQLLDIQRQQTDRAHDQKTTVAVYANGKGAGATKEAAKTPAKTRFEWRTNPRGQGFGVYTQDR